MKKYVLLTLLGFSNLIAQEAANVQVAQMTQPSNDAATNVSTNTMGMDVPAQEPTQNSELIQVQEPQPDDTEEPSIYLNFENASLASVVEYLGEQKKINIIPHKELNDIKVSLTTRHPLTLERAWNVLLTLLEMNTFSMIKVNNVYRIVHAKDNGFEPLPMFSSETGTEPEQLPDSDMVVRYLYFFKNIKAEMARGILSSMIEDSKIRIMNDLNCCILQEQCFNIKAAMKIIKELDLGGLREQIKIIPLKYAEADVLYTLFNEMLQLDQQQKDIRFIGPTTQKERTYFSSSTKIYADNAKNRLILLGTEKNLDKITDFIYKHLDVPLGQAESRLHIYELRYANAETIRPILENILKPPSGGDKSPIVAGYKFFEDVFIASDGGTDASQQNDSSHGSGNRLVIASNKDDWRRLEKFIKKLDKPQPQIAFEIMFVNITSSQDKQLGAQNWGFKGKTPGLGINEFETYNLSDAKPIKTQTTNNEESNNEESNNEDTGMDTSYIKLTTKELNGAAGNPTYITLGRPGGNNINENIWALIKARFNISNHNVIAQPYVIANNNQKCSVDISQTKLIPGPLEPIKGGDNIRKMIEKKAPIKVEINPRINLDGLVDLKLNISINEFKQSLGDDADEVNRSIETRATLYSGEVLVLGGMTRHTDRTTTHKTPLLGDLPIIGTLFKDKTKGQEAENLYVFIRPSIIKPKFEGGSDEYSQLKLDYAKYQMMKNDAFAHEKDPIQRWFFKPSNISTQQALRDRANGVFRPIDDFALGKHNPKSVRMKDDPYFRESEYIAKQKAQRSIARSKQKRSRKAATTIELS